MDFHREVIKFAELVGREGIHCIPGLREEIVDLLARVIACDDLLWTEVDIGQGAAQVVRAEGQPDRGLSRALEAHGASHPSIASYVAGADLRPRRVSDVASSAQWLGSPAWAEGFRATGERYQLSVVTHLGADLTGRGWVFTRGLRDFSGDDVDAATQLWPLLAVLDPSLGPSPRGEAGRPLPPGAGPAEASRPAGGGAPLTRREYEVLGWLSQGLTATSIARRAGTSPRTVSKHLEHIYDKLGCHDRLMAVQRAQTLGILRGGR